MLVYNGQGTQIGSGWSVINYEGAMNMTLIDRHGIELPNGWYGIVPFGELQLVVIPERKQ